MIHDLELVLSLIPSKVERVSALGFSQLGGYEDTAFATLFFENGSIARFKASRVEQRARRYMTLQTPTKSVQIDFAARSATLVLTEMAPRVSTFMQDEFETIELVHEPVDALALEMQNFVSAIIQGERSVVPGDRAARAVVVAEEIVRDLNARSLRVGTSRRRNLRIAG